MTLKSKHQDETALKKQVEEHLIHLRGFDKTQDAKIAKVLGYGKNPFTKLKDPKYKGSGQLLAGLQLLIELKQLRSEIHPKTAGAAIDLEIEALKKRISKLEQRAGNYPEHVDEGLVAAEPKPGEEAPTPQKLLSAEAIEAVTEIVDERLNRRLGPPPAGNA